MLSAWIVLGLLLLVGGAYGQSDEASACYSVSGCNSLRLKCDDDRHIFVMSMQYGFKTNRSVCWTSPSCGDCCGFKNGDCLSDYSDHDFGLMYTNHKCWEKSACTSVAQQTDKGCSGYSPKSTFAFARYSCLKKRDITRFHESTTITAPAVAVFYDGSDAKNYPFVSGENQTWHCRVNTIDSGKPYVDVMLIKESHVSKKDGKCSGVGWISETEEFVRCDAEFRYRSFSVKAPFHVSVRVHENARLPDGWAVVRSRNGSDINVTCGIIGAISTISTSTSTSTGTTPPLPSTSLSPAEGKPATTIFPRSTIQEFSEMTSQTTSASTLHSAEMTSGATSTERRNQQENREEGTNTWAVVGGVVAAVVVLVAAALGVFYFVRRRRTTPRAGSKPTSIRKSSLHMPLTPLTSDSPAMSRTSDPEATGSSGEGPSGTPNPAFHSAMALIHTNVALAGDDGNYSIIHDESKRQREHGNPLGFHGNPRIPAESLDYDRLGEKKLQSSLSNPTATYGRLGEVGGGGDDRDYSYDHLARGRQAAPDVIDSGYDTSALHVTSEGDYNVARIPRKQQVIPGSDYEVAQVVTSEGDYNRVNFEERKQHVITGSDYDTAEIVTSEGDYNRLDFQMKKLQVVTGSDYDVTQVVTSDNAM